MKIMVVDSIPSQQHEVLQHDGHIRIIVQLIPSSSIIMTILDEISPSEPDIVVDLVVFEWVGYLVQGLRLVVVGGGVVVVAAAAVFVLVVLLWLRLFDYVLVELKNEHLHSSSF